MQVCVCVSMQVYGCAGLCAVMGMGGGVGGADRGLVDCGYHLGMKIYNTLKFIP